MRSSERMRRYRERMRAQGLRPVQFWGYDTRAPGFAEEIRRECEAIRRSPDEAEILEFIDQVADWPDD
jgi:hypothetical protein